MAPDPSHPAHPTAHAASLRAVATSLDGTLVLPADAEWEVARSVWNGMIDRQPLGVIRCASPADIAVGVTFARERRLPLAIRGGGHNVAGNGTVDGGLVLDLSLMPRVDVDAPRSIVRVEGGATLGDLDRATLEHTLVVPSGVVSGTGVAGLTLGGGMGWLTRAYGLTVDSLVAAELVAADGRYVHASATEHADLFWGLRGEVATSGSWPASSSRPTRSGRMCLPGPASTPETTGRMPCASMPSGHHPSPTT